MGLTVHYVSCDIVSLDMYFSSFIFLDVVTKKGLLKQTCPEIIGHLRMLDVRVMAVFFSCVRHFLGNVQMFVSKYGLRPSE